MELVRNLFGNVLEVFWNLFVTLFFIIIELCRNLFGSSLELVWILVCIVFIFSRNCVGTDSEQFWNSFGTCLVIV